MFSSGCGVMIRRAAERIAQQPPQARYNTYQKANDLAREAVGCMGVFGALVSRFEESPACVYHTSTVPLGTTGVRRNHTWHTTTPGITGFQHNGRSYRTSTTSTGTTGIGTTRVHDRDRHLPTRKVCRPPCPAAQRIAVQLPRARHKDCQKANDLVREAVGCNDGLDSSSLVRSYS